MKMTRGTAKTETKGSRKKPGRVPFETMMRRVAWAVRNLDDIIVLDQSPLAKLSFVEKNAADHYQDRLCPRGLALRDLITESLDDIISETAGNGLHRLNSLLGMLRNGLNISQASREMGLCREHVSRVYAKQAFRFVTERFLSTAERDLTHHDHVERMKGSRDDDNPCLR
jgi:hypothetical protein